MPIIIAVIIIVSHTYTQRWWWLAGAHIHTTLTELDQVERFFPLEVAAKRRLWMEKLLLARRSETH